MTQPRLNWPPRWQSSTAIPIPVPWVPGRGATPPIGRCPGPNWNGVPDLQQLVAAEQECRPGVEEVEENYAASFHFCTVAERQAATLRVILRAAEVLNFTLERLAEKGYQSIELLEAR